MTPFTNLGDLIPRDRDLGKIAIVDLAGGITREISYGQLDAMANGVARALRARGLERGDRVAILSANCAEYLGAYYGIMRAGLIAVPVSFKFPRATIHFILRDAAAKLVFCDRARVPDCPPDIPSLRFGDEGASGFDRFLELGTFDAVVARAREPAMFLYT
jgi:long-chain acyl-CoA synthetase